MWRAGDLVAGDVALVWTVRVLSPRKDWYEEFSRPPLTLILAWISDDIHQKVWNEIIY